MSQVHAQGTAGGMIWISRVNEPTEPGGISVSITKVAPSNWSKVNLAVMSIRIVTLPTSTEELFLILPDTIQIGRKSPLIRNAGLFRISPSNNTNDDGSTVAGTLLTIGAGDDDFVFS
jgi:hypothetical protein